MEQRVKVSRRDLLAAVVASALGACAASTSKRSPLRTIPVVYDAQGGLFILARVGGHDPVRLILDTGAARSTVSTAYARELGLQLGDGGEVEGSAGIVRSQRATATIDVAETGAVEIDFLVYDFSSYDSACVGILGREWLSRAPFQIRYRESVLAWNAVMPAGGIAMALDHGIPRIAARVNDVEVALRLDTGAALPPGSEYYVNLTAAQAQACGLTGRPAAVWKATGTGGASLDLPVHRLRSLTIADRALAPALAIVQPRVGYFARDDAVGFAGNAVLDKLDPYLDYTGGLFAIGVPSG